MKIYLAGSFSRRSELAAYGAELRALGHDVTSRWHEGERHQASEEELLGEDQTIAIRLASEDWEDLEKAELVIAFSDRQLPKRNEPPDGEVEEWRPVEKSRLNYEVSSFGRVRNDAGDIITGYKNRGYIRVRPNGKYMPVVFVHHLVADAFIGPRPNGHEIDHEDGEKDNNYYRNLRYVTHLENVQAAERLGKHGSRFGEDNGRAKLTWNDVCDIRARHRTGESKAALSRAYGVTDVQIGNIVRAKHWRAEGSRGGKHAEFGLALGLGFIRTWLVGPREHVFHALADRQFASWQEAKAAL